MFNRKLYIIIVLLILLIPYITFAGKIVIGHGKLTMDQPNMGDFLPITLTGDVQTTTSTMGAFNITDGRGTGEGWNIMITATPFTDTATQKIIPQNSIEITTPEIIARGGASDVSTITASSGTIDNPVGLKFLSAAANGGMGKYDVGESQMKITLLPKSTFAGTYTSTLTFNIISGP
jgi:hypothetical protein